MKAKYIDPYTDFGFKKLFGQEGSKELLMDFLNQLLPPEHKIVSLTFKNSERMPASETERRAIFDIHCRNEKGDYFIVEMQKEKIKFFKDRSIFYTTFPIKERAEKGDWDFQLKPIYCVAILDFTFDDERDEKSCISDIQLKDQYCQVFYNKLRYIFIEMPRFRKTEEQLKTHSDKWLYFLKHLEDFDTIPEILNEEIFRKGFEIAEISRFNRRQMDDYEESLKYYRDFNAVVNTSLEEGILIGEKKGFDKGRKEGREEGREEGRKEGREEGKHKKAVDIAKRLKTKGIDIDIIAETSGLTLEEIKAL